MNLNERTTTSGVAVIAPEGRFDAPVTPIVANWLGKVDDHTRVIVNLRDVTFIDSAALAVLVRAMKNYRAQKGDVRLCELRQPVRIIFELTRLDRAFDIFEREADALAAPWG